MLITFQVSFGSSTIYACSSCGKIFSSKQFNNCYLYQVTTTLNWLVRVTSDLESNVVAVERLEEFSHLEPEAAWDTDTALPGGWPGHGEISLEDYSTRCGE